MQLALSHEVTVERDVRINGDDVEIAGALLHVVGRDVETIRAFVARCSEVLVRRGATRAVARMFEKRLRAYQAMGYEIDAELAAGLKDEEREDDE